MIAGLIVVKTNLSEWILRAFCCARSTAIRLLLAPLLPHFSIGRRAVSSQPPPLDCRCSPCAICRWIILLELSAWQSSCQPLHTSAPQIKNAQQINKELERTSPGSGLLGQNPPVQSF